MNNFSFNFAAGLSCFFALVLSGVCVAADESKYVDMEELQELWSEVGGLKEMVRKSDRKAEQERSNLDKFYYGFGASVAVADFNEKGDYPATSRDVPFGFELIALQHELVATADISFQGIQNIFDIIKVNARFGRVVSDRFAVELNYDYMSGFDWDNITPKEGKDYHFGTLAYMFVKTLKTTVKYFPAIVDNKAIRPFVMISAGWMMGEIEARYVNDVPVVIGTLEGTAPEQEDSLEVPLSIAAVVGRDKTADYFYEAGFGVNFIINKTTALTFDVGHSKGTGDVKDLAFNKVTAGFTFSL